MARAQESLRCSRLETFLPQRGCRQERPTHYSLSCRREIPTEREMPTERQVEITHCSLSCLTDSWKVLHMAMMCERCLASTSTSLRNLSATASRASLGHSENLQEG